MFRSLGATATILSPERYAVDHPIAASEVGVTRQA